MAHKNTAGRYGYAGQFRFSYHILFSLRMQQRDTEGECPQEEKDPVRKGCVLS